MDGPKVTPAELEAEISAEFYFTADEGALGAYKTHDDVYQSARHDDNVAQIPLSLLTFCVLVLRNGFTVTGESACASPANFDEAIDRKIARQNAVNKVWPLLGFRLRDKLAAATTEASNEASHAFRVTNGGLLCSRCGASEGTGGRRSCDERWGLIEKQAR